MRHPKSIVQWFNPNFSWWNHIHCPISDFGWRLIGVHQQGELQPQVRGLAQVWSINALDPSFFKNGSDHFESDFPLKNMLDPSFLTDLHVSSDFPWKPMGLGALDELRRRVQRGSDHGGCWTGASVQALPRHGFPWRFRPSINGDFMVIETNQHGIFPLKCTQSNKPKSKWIIIVI